MRGIKMGYDLDGVLAEFSDHFLKYFNFADKSPPSEWDDRRFRDNFHLTYGNKNFWMTIPPIVPKDSQVLKFLPPHCYITARPIPNEWTMEWLWKMGFPHADLYTVGEKGEKSEVFLKSGATHFVDDGLHNFDELSSIGVPCFLLTRPHNVSRETGMRINKFSDLPNAVIEFERALLTT